MGRPEGPLGYQGRRRWQQPAHAVDLGDVQGLGSGQLRQYGGEGARQKRLSAAWRPAHQQVVAARGRDLQRPLGVLLSPDVGQVYAARSDEAGRFPVGLGGGLEPAIVLRDGPYELRAA